MNPYRKVWSFHANLLPLLPRGMGSQWEAGLPLTLRGGGPRGGDNGSLALSAPLPFTLAPLCTSREPAHTCVGIEPAPSHICSCILGVPLPGPVCLEEGFSVFGWESVALVAGVGSRRRVTASRLILYLWSWRLSVALVKISLVKRKAQGRAPGSLGLRAGTGEWQRWLNAHYISLNYLTHYSKHSGV